MIVLVVPDTHSPFMHKNALDFLSDLKKEYKPDKIVHLGDEMDQHALSDWDHDPDGMSAGDEYEASIRQIKGLYKLFPDVYVCESNHGRRPFRKALRGGLPRAYLRAYAEFMKSPPGWEWRHKWTLENVAYQHGDGFTGNLGAYNAAFSNRKSTVIGHIHSNAGVIYLGGSYDQIFAMNAGCLIDVEAYAFKYGINSKHKPVLGAGIVIDGKYAEFKAL